MFGALLGAIPGVIGAIMQGQAQQEQNYTNEQNLMFQKENARKQYALATAGRTDAYGNKMSYDEALNQWDTQLTPQQKAILQAQQAEQLYSMTEGTRRAHELAARQEARSKEAGPIYEKLLRDYQFNTPKSEGAYTDEAVSDELRANAEKTKGAGNQLATLAVRSGQDPNALTGIMKAVADQQGGGLATGIQKGKALGRQTYAGETQLHDAKLKPLDFFASLADKINPTSIMPTSTPEALARLQSEGLAGISGALANESNQVGGAFSTLARSLGQSPDLSGIANALMQFKDPSGDSNIFAPASTGSTGGAGGIFDDPYSIGTRTTGGVNYTSPDNIYMYQHQHGSY